VINDRLSASTDPEITSSSLRSVCVDTYTPNKIIDICLWVRTCSCCVFESKEGFDR